MRQTLPRKREMRKRSCYTAKRYPRLVDGIYALTLQYFIKLPYSDPVYIVDMRFAFVKLELFSIFSVGSVGY